jgi:predicted GNAT family N-acyltransferase
MSDLLIRVADRPDDFPLVYKIRYRVFQVEQGVDPELEFDQYEDQAEHLLAYLDGKVVGTARIRLLDAQTGKVERVAVLPEARGQGIGRKLMEKAMQILIARNVPEVQIHAQEKVRDFYQRLGFVPQGAVFEEAGIPHIKMKKLLR